jgi:3-isopropylmalate dehydrogenase
VKEFKILLLPGDGIGPEITRQAVKVLEKIGDIFNINFKFKEALIGGAAIDAKGNPLPEETITEAKNADAVLLAAVGGPKWDTTDPAKKRPEDGLLLLRKTMDVFANIRPVKVYDQLAESSPLKEDIIRGTDLVIIRELTGGIYFGEKKRESDFALDTCPYSTTEIDRTLRVAFEMAGKRKNKVTLVDKANVLETSRLWRERFQVLKAEYPGIETEILLVDNAAMQLIRRPSSFDVLVTENMFGDILSDEAATISGSIGMLASASVGKDHPYLYEPIHGSAPDIAGKNLANPLGMILSSSLMLKHSFNEFDAASLVEAAVEKAIEDGYRTRDLAGKSDRMIVGTEEMGDLIVEYIEKLANSGG